MQERPNLFDKALLLFANKYGFLGQFEREYVRHPTLPEQKHFIAPEAIIDGSGKLQKLDPSTKGRELVYELKVRQRHPAFVELPNRLLNSKPPIAGLSESRLREALKLDQIAVPSETRFVPKVVDGGGGLDGELSVDRSPWDPVSWETIKRRFGATMILDERSPTGASVLCTREPHSDWLIHLRQFPSPDTAPARDIADYIGSVSGDVSPHALVGEDESLAHSWRCNSLLEAMGVMLLFDLTLDNSIKKCDSRGCLNYFRIGSQSGSKYCSERCANRASTRMQRGQEP